MIINFVYPNVRDFLEDSQQLSKSHVIDAFENKDGFKIIVELKAHFKKNVAIKEDAQIVYFLKKSSVVLKSTNFGN